MSDLSSSILGRQKCDAPIGVGADGARVYCIIPELCFASREERGETGIHSRESPDFPH